MSDSASLIGEELAHFKVIAKLGEGGMGAVYRAEDTKLGRQVALKVIPEELAQESERLARLRREAQILASLNHTNIAAIYGLEELDGRLILELELVEGEELAQRLKRGALALDETIDIATQIASGLEEAHERGVIHRDLKPANLMITPEGVVKILDFGLAKPYVEDSIVDGVSKLATVTGDDMTREGVIMGTASYMSPEQARGRKVDRRSDIWAFGCVLYEMVTGRRAFGGETMTDVLVSVVTGEPDWSLVPIYTPPGVRRLLRRCLQRDPRNRLRNLGDAVIELAEASEPGDGSGIPGLETAPPSRSLALWAVVGPLLGVVLGVALWWFLGIDEARVQRPVRQLATVSEPVAVYGSFAPSLAVSPDGGQLIYSAGSPRRLFGQLRDQLESAPISGTDGAAGPFFSPDGRFVGFWADDALKKVPVGGGVPVTLVDTSDYFFGATWAPDGYIYYSRPWVLEDGAVSIALVRVSENGGAIELVAEADPVNGRTVALAWPELLPDGRNLLVTRWATDGRPPGIEIVSIDDGSRRTVIEGYQQAVFVPSGYLVAGTPGGQVVALPFDLGALEVTGGPVPIANAVNRSRYRAQHFAVGSDGALFWVPEVGVSRPDELVWVDHEGNAEPASSHLRHYEAPRLSSDGFVVVGIRSAHDDVNIWLLDPVRDTLRPLTIETGYSQMPLWTPDGLGVVYTVPLGNEQLPAGIYLRGFEVHGEPELLVPGPLKVPTSISADGEVLLFHTIGVNTGWDLWSTGLVSGGDPELVLAAPFDQVDACFAPQENWIAFEADPSGRSEIYVRRIGENGIEGQISPHGGRWPVWNLQGDELFYLGETSMMSVKVELVGEPSVEPARTLFDIDGYGQTFDVSADGQRFLMIRLGQEPSGRQINVTLDWQGAPPSGLAPAAGS
jgi:serine/threonine-protein kinase